MIKLIASDMDGTLLNNNHDIDVETVEAIRKAEEAGIIFAISTGREYDSVKGLLDKHNIRCQCILSNGAEYRDEDGNILEVININEKYAKQIIQILAENKLPARIFTDKGVFTTSTREEALQEVVFRTLTFNPNLTKDEAKKMAEKEGFFTSLKYIDDVEKFFENGIEVRKFVAFHKDVELIDKMKKTVGKLEGLAISSSFDDNIEITDLNAQKGIILEQVAKKMDIDIKDVMILGDSFNDYSMFEIFEESVAMKNAIPEVKEIAKYITDSNDNLGVAKAIYNVLNNEMNNMIQ
ncbi:Cof-type HAD-IIB family hydrolase [Clostridium botulinum]|uniref:HAD-superfamily hydrolase, subfamily IIB n=1 Tax=Clostridium botulinum (strain Eklund 17B / Type B) TaxID=935198 RepID=B2TJQ3_CLOBB|nr:Cof-type HAD-IIB family hydrolase [Clostridium sp. VAP51]ACD22422.1 HAD-superfamily hydrolase, subfamily IIB [Clostridium botulinum B str. Eklund 17B (NRP)]MBY6974746.1 Cof-type HAD-IIB family hydrolase [Clostridium botulinum]MBY6999732.1 Cof-type HAD-IIB family hydrolase [Clostridium botulinum]MCR1275035.1 Cof-type HAD-IIB family hydrolase [Clostridium botulinum]NFD70714.1 Cof-type HAD-IIB family hydrolase [Clostridium botulinum]